MKEPEYHNLITKYSSLLKSNNINIKESMSFVELSDEKQSPDHFSDIELISVISIELIKLKKYNDAMNLIKASRFKITTHFLKKIYNTGHLETWMTFLKHEIPNHDFYKKMKTKVDTLFKNKKNSELEQRINNIKKKYKKYGLSELNLEEMELLQSSFETKTTEMNSEKKKRSTSEKPAKKKQIIVSTVDTEDILNNLKACLDTKYLKTFENVSEHLMNEIEHYQESLVFDIEEPELSDFVLNSLLEDLFTAYEDRQTDSQLEYGIVVRCSNEKSNDELFRLLNIHQKNSLYSKILTKSIARKAVLFENVKKGHSVSEKINKARVLEANYIKEKILSKDIAALSKDKIENVLNALMNNTINYLSFESIVFARLVFHYIRQSEPTDRRLIHTLLNLNPKYTLIAFKTISTEKEFIGKLDYKHMALIIEIEKRLKSRP